MMLTDLASPNYRIEKMLLSRVQIIALNRFKEFTGILGEKIK